MSKNQPLPLYSEILPKLYIGGTDDRDVIQNPNRSEALVDCTEFESVVTLYAYANPKGWQVSENRYGFPDSRISIQDKQAVRQLSLWLHGEWKSGKCSLARCQAGLNRSSLVVAMVMLLEGFSAEEAIDLIRARRSVDCLFNQSFVDFIFEEYQNLKLDATLAA
jgi:hypothetical protein